MVCFRNKLKTAWKSELSTKNRRVFSCWYYLRLSKNTIQLICWCNDGDNLFRFTKLVNRIPEFQLYYCVLEKETLFQKIEDQKLQTMQLLKQSCFSKSYCTIRKVDWLRWLKSSLIPQLMFCIQL